MSLINFIFSRVEHKSFIIPGFRFITFPAMVTAKQDNNLHFKKCLFETCSQVILGSFGKVVLYLKASSHS